MKKLVLLFFALLSSMAFGQGASLMPSPCQQFRDPASDAPLAGGKIYSYVAGSSTPSPTYTDRTGSVQNTNPVILDSAGVGCIWIGSVPLKIVIKDANDVQIRAVDYVSNNLFASLITSTQFNATNNYLVNGSPLALTNLADYTDAIFPYLNNVYFVGEGITQWSGTDVGGWINSAYAACPTGGCHIVVIPKADNTCYDYTTPIVLSTAGKFVLLESWQSGGQQDAAHVGCLNFTPTSGKAITMDFVPSTGRGRSGTYGLKNIYLTNGNCTSIGGCGGTAYGIDVDVNNAGIDGAVMDTVGIQGFNVGFRERDIPAACVTWTSPRIYNNGYGWQLGGSACEQINGGQFYGNTYHIGNFDSSSRPEIHAEGTNFIAHSSIGLNFTVTTGNPAQFFGNNLHFEAPAGQNPHFIDGDVDVIMQGGLAEDDNSSCGSSDWWFQPAGNVFLWNGGRVVTANCNPSTGIIDIESPAKTRILFSPFIANNPPSGLSALIGGTAALVAKASVCPLASNTDSTPFTCVQEALFQSSNTKQQLTSNFTTTSTTYDSGSILFTWAIPAQARNYSFDCWGSYQQATATGGLTFGYQTETNAAPTMANGVTWSTNAGANNSATVSANTTTATNVVSVTPGATATNYPFHLSGTFENPASANNFRIRVISASASDQVTVVRGSYCQLF